MSAYECAQEKCEMKTWLGCNNIYGRQEHEVVNLKSTLRSTYMYVVHIKLIRSVSKSKLVSCSSPGVMVLQFHPFWMKMRPKPLGLELKRPS